MEPPSVELTAEELRVLACLVEKAYTTPEQYPLSSNALTGACNQKTSRDPVVDYSTQLVDRTLQLLRDAGWARSVRGVGNRTHKHKHVVDERLGLTDRQQAVWAVLALRGPQSPGELRTRTKRYLEDQGRDFEDLDDVEATLRELRDREPSLAANVGRAAGQSQDRWIQLLGRADVDSGGGTEPSAVAAPQAATEPSALTASQAGAGAPSIERPAPDSAPDSASPSVATPSATGSGADLEARVEALERRLAALERELGVD